MTNVTRGLWRVLVVYPARIITLAIAIIALLNEFSVTALTPPQTQAITTLIAALVVLCAGMYDAPSSPTHPDHKTDEPRV